MKARQWALRQIFPGTSDSSCQSSFIHLYWHSSDNWCHLECGHCKPTVRWIPFFFCLLPRTKDGSNLLDVFQYDKFDLEELWGVAQDKQKAWAPQTTPVEPPPKMYFSVQSIIFYEHNVSWSIQNITVGYRWDQVSSDWLECSPDEHPDEIPEWSKKPDMS